MRFRSAISWALLFLSTGAMATGDKSEGNIDWLGEEPRKADSVGGQNRWFEVAVSYGGRTDESQDISKSFTMSGAFLYRMNPCLAAQLGLGVEKTSFRSEIADREGASTFGELLMRAERKEKVISPFVLSGVGYRHCEYKDRWGTATGARFGLVLGAGLAIEFTQGAFLDVGVRHEINHIEFESTVYAPTPPWPPGVPYSRSAQVSEAMLNPTVVLVQFRRELK